MGRVRAARPSYGMSDRKRYVLFSRRKSPLAEEIALIRQCRNLTILDSTSDRAFLVQGEPSAISSLKSQLPNSNWVIDEERILPGPRQTTRGRDA
jgi:hypothetical protein